MNKNRTSATKQLAYGGVFSALSFVLLFLACVVPTLEMTFYAAASMMPAFMILEYAFSSKKATATPGVLVYVTTVILGFLLIPNKVAILPYALFFGIYGIIKYYIEKFGNRWVMLALKLIIFGGLFSTAYFLFKELLISSLSLPDTVFPVMLFGALIFLMLYDYIFSMAIAYYLNRVHAPAMRASHKEAENRKEEKDYNDK